MAPRPEANFSNTEFTNLQKRKICMDERVLPTKLIVMSYSLIKGDKKYMLYTFIFGQMAKFEIFA